MMINTTMLLLMMMMMMMMICHRGRLFSYWWSVSCICGGSCCFSTRSVASSTALQVIATPELASRATSTDVGSAHKWGCLPNGVWENSHGLTWATTQSTVLVEGANEGSHSVFWEKHVIKSIFAIFQNGVCSLENDPTNIETGCMFLLASGNLFVCPKVFHFSRFGGCLCSAVFFRCTQTPAPTSHWPCGSLVFARLLFRGAGGGDPCKVQLY